MQGACEGISLRMISMPLENYVDLANDDHAGERGRNRRTWHLLFKTNTP